MFLRSVKIAITYRLNRIECALIYDDPFPNADYLVVKLIGACIYCRLAANETSTPVANIKMTSSLRLYN